MGYRWLAVVCLILAMAAAAAAQPSLSGFVALDAQNFLHPPTFPQQESHRILPSLLLQPEFYYDWPNGNDSLTVVPMARLDSSDDQRQHFDLRELNWLHAAPRWDLLVGVGKVFWGVTEARNLVDVINQTDQVEDLDGDDKLGQPMVRLALIQDWGTLSFFAMPYFRERTFRGEKGRLRAPFVWDTDNTQFESSLEEWHPDFAARGSHALGDWDVALGYFRGTSREPRFTLHIRDDGQLRLVPVYDQVDQVGLELQWTVEAWLWKLEAISRWGHGEHFSAAVAGFEYSFFGLFGTALDLGLVAEYLYDGRSAAAPGTPFDNDVFVGGRLAFNDVGSTSILAGVIVDDQSGSMLATVEASRRLGDRWTVEVESLSFFDVPPTGLLYGVHRDDYVQIRLSFFF
jgi:hypothetical protein